MYRSVSKLRRRCVAVDTPKRTFPGALSPISTPTIPQATLGIDYVDLYRRWEKGHWLATEIDFSQDRIDWREKMSPEQKRAAMWFFSLFFHGEDSVTDDLAPFIGAAPTEEQTYFLTTQQVDEARHAVFFQRFFHEVVGLGDGSPGSGLTATKHQLTWGHRKMFAHLDAVADRLRTDHSPAMYAEALTMYHVIVEGTLAQPGQHMLEAWLEEIDLLPGFRAGMAMVSHDEQRHIAFGIKALSELYAAHPHEVGEAIVGTFVSTQQWLAAFDDAFDVSFRRCESADIHPEPLGDRRANLVAIKDLSFDLTRFDDFFGQRLERGLSLEIEAQAFHSVQYSHR